MDSFLEVAFSLPLMQNYTYRAPDGETGEIGCRVEAILGRRKLIGWIVGLSEKAPEGNFTLKQVIRMIDKQPLFDSKLLKQARWMADFYLCSLGEALSVMLPGGKREVSAGSTGLGEEPFPEKDIILSEEQQEAIGGILSRTDGISYLYGITGSGKTEVFLQLTRKTLEEGRGVIYLVPEIALTHQVIDSFRRRFPGKTAMLHSGLTPSQKLSEWRKIQSGETPLVVGARSAVFAPLPRLGLVIIDEEHETSYKSGNTPRYHARQIAMKRCREESARLVMGSATPSVESWYMFDSKRIQGYFLTKRLSGGCPPSIDIIDMKQEKGILSAPLIKQIERTIQNRRQVILFLNRRGFSYFFHCPSCGYQMTCSRCSVSMTYHKETHRMQCHYCGMTRLPVKVCPECGSLEVGYSGFGTEKVEDEVASCFPEARICRIDTDAVKKKGYLQDILSRFARGEIDILLGTQMVAKGLNFPGVQLVGIVMADTGLNLPDFRAEERTFSLIVQVAGRAGRFIPDGKVLLQTWKPTSAPIRLAAENRIEEFYRRETEMRQELGFPPFSRIFRLVLRGKRKELVEKTLLQITREILPHLPAETELLGPSECPLGCISMNHRYHILLSGRKFDEIHRLLAHYLRQIRLPGGIHLEFDIDPVSLL